MRGRFGPHARLAAVTVAAVAWILAAPATGAVAAPMAHWLVISQPAPTYFDAGDAADCSEISGHLGSSAGSSVTCCPSLSSCCTRRRVRRSVFSRCMK